MKRRGRKRKLVRRQREGSRLRPVRAMAESPAVRAAAMPHRSWLGAKAVDQLAENELGRLVLAGRLARELALAGEYYAAAWRGYVSTLAGPKRLAAAPIGMKPHGGYDCGGCLDLINTRFCMCAARRDKWTAAMHALRAAGWPAMIAVQMVALHDHECPPDRAGALQDGLRALAHHFGILTKIANRNTTNRTSQLLEPPAERA
jgi:hypothetical protein